MHSLATKRLLTACAIDNAASKEIIDWATTMLADGLDSPHLRVLAGYTEPQAEADLEQFQTKYDQNLGRNTKRALMKPPSLQEYEERAAMREATPTTHNKK